MAGGTNGINGRPAARFTNSSSQYFVLPDSADVHPATLALACVFTQLGSPQYCHLFSRSYSASWVAPYVSYSVSLNDDAAHTPEFAVTVGGSRIAATASGYTYASGTHILICNYDGIAMRVYMDGQLIKYQAQTGAVDYSNPSTSNRLGRTGDVSPGYFINALVAEASISRALMDYERRGIEQRWSREYGVKLIS